MDRVSLLNQLCITEELEKNKIKIEFEKIENFNNFVNSISSKIYKNKRLENYKKSIFRIEYELNVEKKKRFKSTAVSNSISTLDGTTWEQYYKDILRYRDEYYSILGTGYSITWNDKLFDDSISDIIFSYPTNYRKNSSVDEFNLVLGEKYDVTNHNFTKFGIPSASLLAHFRDNKNFYDWITDLSEYLICELSEDGEPIKIITPPLTHQKLSTLYQLDVISTKFLENLSDIKLPCNNIGKCIVFDVQHNLYPTMLLQIEDNNFIRSQTIH